MSDPFSVIRKAQTAGPNYDLDTDAIIARLTQWQRLCSFTVTSAEADKIDIQFKTLPKDMDAFAQDLYEFCPDLVDQGTGCLHEFLEAMEEADESPTPEMQQLIKGIDFDDENYGVEILKREIQRDKKVSLWWD